MKRFLVVAIVAAALAPTAAAASPVQAMQRHQPGPPDRWSGPCSGWKYGEYLTTPRLFNADVIRSKTMMLRLVWCVFHEVAPGNEQHAVYVAERESGLLPWAVNPCGCYLGLFQHMSSAWASRAAAYLDHWMFRRWPAHWADPRANAWVSARMVKQSGWGPWGG